MSTSTLIFGRTGQMAIQLVMNRHRPKAWQRIKYDGHSPYRVNQRIFAKEQIPPLFKHRSNLLHHPLIIFDFFLKETCEVDTDFLFRKYQD